MLQANKVLRLARSSKKVKQEEIVQFTKRKQPDESLKERFFSIGHNVDFELTLPFLLGSVPWSMSTPDRISTKLTSPNFYTASNYTLNQHKTGHVVLHITDGNPFTTKHNSFSCHLDQY